MPISGESSGRRQSMVRRLPSLSSDFLGNGYGHKITFIVRGLCQGLFFWDVNIQQFEVGSVEANAQNNSCTESMTFSKQTASFSYESRNTIHENPRDVGYIPGLRVVFILRLSRVGITSPARTRRPKMRMSTSTSTCGTISAKTKTKTMAGR